MGQKVHPHGVRVGIIKDWDSKWYADKNNFGDNLVEVYKIRKYLKKSQSFKIHRRGNGIVFNKSLLHRLK